MMMIRTLKMMMTMTMMMTLAESKCLSEVSSMVPIPRSALPFTTSAITPSQLPPWQPSSMIGKQYNKALLDIFDKSRVEL